MCSWSTKMNILADLDFDIHRLLHKTPTKKQSTHKQGAYKKNKISARVLEKLRVAGASMASHVLLHLPAKYEQRDSFYCIHEAYERAEKSLIKVQVQQQFFINTRQGKVLCVKVQHKDQFMRLYCFGRNYLSKKLLVGSTQILYARVYYKDRLYYCSDFDILNENERILGLFSRARRLGELRPHQQQGLLLEVLDFAREYAHTLYASTNNEAYFFFNADASHFPTRIRALAELHNPLNQERLEEARRTIAYTELLLFLLALGQEQAQNKDRLRLATGIPRKLIQKLESQLPFSLLPEQYSALDDILHDFEKKQPMRRLLQGDVGSGKTIVALLSALSYIEQKKQVVLFAPTETLARQHYNTIRTFCADLAIPILLITGSMKRKERELAYTRIENNEALLIIGTHALFSKDVVYSSLTYVIIDEQHRLGIGQRASLVQKGKNPDVLLMSATPIPRSLALTLYNNLDISTLKKKPAQTSRVQTRLIDITKRTHTYAYISSLVARGQQIYMVVPHIDSAEQELLGLQDMYQEISQEFAPHRVDLLHSRIESSEQQHIMQNFVEGKISILLSTSIIEVGIDVMNASCICIFEAQRFGLATLHQLRGRVGRGTIQGSALLFFRTPLTETARERLRIMYTSDDGFEIAEQDLKLRGPGDIHVLGIRQSGLYSFLCANISEDLDLIYKARTLAHDILIRDPKLEMAQHAPLRQCLSGNMGII